MEGLQLPEQEAAALPARRAVAWAFLSGEAELLEDKHVAGLGKRGQQLGVSDVVGGAGVA